MKLCIIGSGRMGKALARAFEPNFHQIAWASRDKARIEAFIHENKLTRIAPASHSDAFEADVLIPALWFKDLIPWAKENEEKLANKILVDISNPFTEDFTGLTLPWGTSAAEELQKAVPAAHVVGAFKNTFFPVLEDPIHEGLKSDVYITSNHKDAKQAVLDLLQPLPFRVLDGGSLENNRLIERLTVFEREMAIRYGSYPYISNRLFGIPSNS